MQWLNHHDSFWLVNFQKKIAPWQQHCYITVQYFLGNRSRSWYKCHLVICEAFRSVLVTLLIFCLKQSNTAQKDKTRPCSKPYDTSRYTCIYTLNFIKLHISRNIQYNNQSPNQNLIFIYLLKLQAVKMAFLQQVKPDLNSSSSSSFAFTKPGPRPPRPFCQGPEMSSSLDAIIVGTWTHPITIHGINWPILFHCT